MPGTRHPRSPPPAPWGCSLRHPLLILHALPPHLCSRSLELAPRPGPTGSDMAICLPPLLGLYLAVASPSRALPQAHSRGSFGGCQFWERRQMATRPFAVLSSGLQWGTDQVGSQALMWRMPAARGRGSTWGHWLPSLVISEGIKGAELSPSSLFPRSGKGSLPPPQTFGSRAHVERIEMDRERSRGWGYGNLGVWGAQPGWET